jgi:hypothetical protein
MNEPCPASEKGPPMLSDTVSKFVRNESTELPPQDAREGISPPLTEKQERVCPNCGEHYRPGELICGTCGVLFPKQLRTNRLDGAEAADLERSKRVGKAITDQFRPLLIDIAGQTVSLPFGESTVLGRISDMPGDVSVDIDLNPFGAVETGVSRNHARLTRDRELMHVIDLGSTNGTYLNGFRLNAHQKRILRSGDELTLGRLKMVVKF